MATRRPRGGTGEVGVSHRLNVVIPFVVKRDRGGRAMTFQIIYQDDAVVVLEKPAGLLAVPGRGVENQVNLASQVREIVSDALVVHRLDRDTSGLMVMGRG